MEPKEAHSAANGVRVHTLSQFEERSIQPTSFSGANGLTGFLRTISTTAAACSAGQLLSEARAYPRQREAY